MIPRIGDSGVRARAAIGKSTTRATGLPVVLLFAKLPLAGHAKTRLAREIGADRAAEFAAAFLADTWSRVLEWGRAPIWLCGDARDGTPFRPHLHAPLGHYLAQGTGDLGARLARGFRIAFSRGASAAIAIGADTPHLPLARLDDAIAALARGSAALGPARDGGFYLLALPRMRKLPPRLFTGHAWGTATVLRGVRAALVQSDIECHELDDFWDFDALDDLVQWKRKSFSRDPRETLPRRTMALISDLGL
ncbi:MAG: TIGR04282 family arsenosugar biosynthesis glycosyltransferase [Planctomycetes bacterium]|nr:TIGR04282 family arsenosugar biosynthesis glycosyltransferase [Planctomycetota bacterium]